MFMCCKKIFSNKINLFWTTTLFLYNILGSFQVDYFGETTRLFTHLVSNAISLFAFSMTEWEGD
jgi:hypothetical protein